MAVSKTELMYWLNDLLQLQYHKVEQCGSGAFIIIPLAVNFIIKYFLIQSSSTSSSSGAAYCQILDSIYGSNTNFRSFSCQHQFFN